MTDPPESARLRAGRVDAKPVPVKVTVAGLSSRLSVTSNVAVRRPEADGIKVTLILQLSPEASALELSGQSLLTAKSAEAVPLTLMPLMLSAPG